MSANVLELSHVTKRYSGHVAVDDLDLAVPAGGIFGLLGPNGAGKTTTIRMIMNILTPDDGTVTLFGGGGSGRDYSNRIGYLPEERGLYPRMKVLDQLTFLGETKGIKRATAAGRAKHWLERLGLAEWGQRKVQDLSKGMQQKVQFIGALMHEPDLVILDEPFSGLDPVNSQVMKDIVVETARSGRTVIFSTHIMEQAERMCDRIAIIARGRKVLDGTLTEIKRSTGHLNVMLAFSREPSLARPVLQNRSLIGRIDDYGSSAEVELAPGADAEQLLRDLVATGVGLSRFEVVEPSLQSIFIARVGADAAAAPAEVSA